MLKHSTADKTIQSAQSLLDNSQHLANGALNGISHAFEQGVERAHNVSTHLRDSANQLSHDTSSTIRHDPVKSVLIAAASGAVLMALAGLLTRSYSRR